MTKSKILLIEDQMDLGNVVRQYLEISDFEVDWLTNGRLAYDRLLKWMGFNWPTRLSNWG